MTNNSDWSEYYPLTNKSQIKYSFGKNSNDCIYYFHTKGNDDERIMLTPDVFEIVKNLKQTQRMRSQVQRSKVMQKKKRKDDCLGFDIYCKDISDENILLLSDKKIFEITKSYMQSASLEHIAKEGKPRHSDESIQSDCEQIVKNHIKWSEHTKKMFEYQDKVDDLDFRIKKLKNSFDRHPEKVLRLHVPYDEHEDDFGIKDFIDITDFLIRFRQTYPSSLQEIQEIVS